MGRICLPHQLLRLTNPSGAFHDVFGAVNELSRTLVFLGARESRDVLARFKSA